MDTTNLNTFINTFIPADSAHNLYLKGLITSLELLTRLTIILDTMFFTFNLTSEEYSRLLRGTTEYTNNIPFKITNV